MKSLYRKIAKEHGVSVAEVKCEMQLAINHAYQSNQNNEITTSYQNQVPCKGEIPTTEEFILFYVKKIINEK